MTTFITPVHVPYWTLDGFSRLTGDPSPKMSAEETNPPGFFTTPPSNGKSDDQFNLNSPRCKKEEGGLSYRLLQDNAVLANCS